MQTSKTEPEINTADKNEDLKLKCSLETNWKSIFKAVLIVFVIVYATLAMTEPFGMKAKHHQVRMSTIITCIFLLFAMRPILFPTRPTSLENTG
jgi:hypothetical protein